MDLKYSHGTEISLVRACYNEDAVDLVAIAGKYCVEVLQCVWLASSVRDAFVLNGRVFVELQEY